MIARQAQRPIMPVAIATTRYIALPTWSRMTINLPFSGLGFAVGPLVHVPAEATPEELEAARKAVEESLNIATRLAYQRAGADPTRATPGLANVKPGPRLKLYRMLTSALSPSRGFCSTPARAAARKTRAAAMNAWGSRRSLGLPAHSLVSRGQRRRDARHPAFDGYLGRGAARVAVPAHHRHRDIGEDRGREAEEQRAAPVRPARRTGAVRRFLDHWRPDLAVFTESEIWPNLILESSARGIPLTLVNARMTERSFRRWRRNKGVARPLFSALHWCLRRTKCWPGASPFWRAEGRARRQSQGGFPASTVDLDEYARLKHMLAGRPVLIAASTHEGEETIIADAHVLLSKSVSNLLTVIAPRHPSAGRALRNSCAIGGCRCHCGRAGSRSTTRARSMSQTPSASSAVLQDRDHRLHRRLARRARRPEPDRGRASGRHGVDRPVA